jgi:prepilin-type N-terminal cleavage/methylation domain-containing protein/prepilin-type processing-associated H-X9-DG protein
MSRTRGFTLIELLVVIAIIAILAAILFPVFARARAKAQQNNCLANLKQQALAVNMYMSDYDEASPGRSRSNPDGTFTVYAEFLYPYVKNAQIFICPGDSVSNAVGARGGTWLTANPDILYCSYGWNLVDGNYLCTTTSGPDWGRKSGDIDMANTICIMDVKSNPSSINEVTCIGSSDSARDVGLSVSCNGGAVWDGTPLELNGSIYSASARHADGCNTAFMDGHAKWFKFGAMKKEMFSYGFD